MTESQIIEENFFVIDSHNLGQVKSKLYGFMLTDEGKILTDGDAIPEKSACMELGGGTFVWVNSKTDDTIEITQDFDGSYGLYLFRESDYFALSNSFWKLVEWVYRSYEITFNYDYAASFIALPLNSMAYSQTLIKEISMLPRNSKIILSKQSKQIEIQSIEINENKIELDSEKAFKIIDTWYDKWTSLFRNLKKQTDEISIDLSGGFDSRVAFIPALGANIDLKRVNINSASDGLHTHGEDYEIASAIGKKFGFTLNTPLKVKRTPYRDKNTVFNISWYTKGGFHKQMYWKFNCTKEPVFSFGGSGGEIVNGHGMLGVVDRKVFLENQLRRAKQFSPSFEEPIKNVMDDMLDNVIHQYGVSDSCNYTSLLLYRDTISRNHFGKANVEKLFSNCFSLQPLMDPLIRTVKTSTKGCPDTHLLMAILLTRYIPELLDFPFQGGRKIEEDTIKFAKKLNAKYPYKKINELSPSQKEFISEPTCERTVKNFLEIDESDNSVPAVNRNDIEHMFTDLFNSNTFKNMFTSFFPINLYDRLSYDSKSRDYFPLQEIYASVSAMQAVEYAHTSKVLQDMTPPYKSSFSNFFERIKRYDEFNNEHLNFSLSAIKKYFTARIDIKNEGKSSNTVEILFGQDKLSWSAYPAWFTNNKGKGLVVQCERGTLDLELKCFGSGELKINLRGVDSRDKNGVRFPVWVDYTAFSMDGKTVFDTSHTVWHDKPFVYSQKVTDGQVVKLHAEWKPLDSQSNFE